LRFNRLKADRVAVAAAGLLVLLALSCSAVPVLEWLLGIDATEADLLRRFDEPSALHWLGNDEAGRDVALRLLMAARSRSRSVCSVPWEAPWWGHSSVPAPAISGGRVDMVLMRFTDFMISLPGLPLPIILAAVDLAKLGIARSFHQVRCGGLLADHHHRDPSRLDRGSAPCAPRSTLALVEREFVTSARAQGAGAWWIVSKHILPNAISPIIVATTLATGRIMLTESGLSFLGVGIQPPMTSWGAMLTNAQDLMVSAPQLALYPGVLIFVTVLAINFVGDGLQSAFDPRWDPR
jgi:peptide/nickel transport system permease protein